MSRLGTRIARLFRRRKHEAAVDVEIQFHMDALVAQYRAEGMSEEDARLAARREFGDLGSYREEIRDVWHPPPLAEIARTLRFACRSLLRSPQLTILAVLTLAFGVGVNTLMFSAFDSIILKPLPYPEVAQLFEVDRATPHDRYGKVSPGDYRELGPELGAAAEVAAFEIGEASVAEPGRPPEVVRSAAATANLLALLGVAPQLGRGFLPGEDRPGHDRVVVLSHRAWQIRFGGRPDIIGSAVRIDGVPHEIVGVLPESFNDWRHLGSIEVFHPLAPGPQELADRGHHTLRVIGRRAAGVPQARIDAVTTAFGARLAADHPDENVGASWRSARLADRITGKNGPTTMAMLIALSGFVLLIACSNLANLLLARTVSRARELAVRAALGASRGQLLRPLIAESLLLSLAGGALALLVARWGADWLSIRSTADNGQRVIFDFDWRVFGWALGVALATAVAFSVAPALYTLRLNLGDTLKNGGRGATGGRGHRRFRHVLIVAQFALAMILLSGAGLMIRGLDELNHRRAGWTSEHLVTGAVSLPADVYGDAARIDAFQRQAATRLRALPGVASAGVSAYTPFFDWPEIERYVAQGSEPPERGHEPAAVVNSVTPGTFETYGTPIVDGRAFDAHDTADAPRVFVINRAMATALFGEASPIGRRLVRAGGDAPLSGEIVGVVADVKSVLPDPTPVVFQVYQPLAQAPRRNLELAVRTDGVAPAEMVERIREAMKDIDPDLPVRRLQSADATIERANYELGVLRDVLAGFAVLGLGLALLGVYGVIARTMAQRNGEFAIRYALGARVVQVTRIVLASGLKLALLGASIGLLGALAVSRVLAAAHPGMRLERPVVLVTTTLLLIGVAVLASWLPARRAARISPADALRAE